MDQTILLNSISKPISKSNALALASQHGDSLSTLLSLCCCGDRQIEFRASWIIEMAVRLRPGTLVKCVPDFVDMYCIIRNRSCQRHFTKIMMDLTRRIERFVIKDSDIERVVAITFVWLIDPRTPVAVTANCMDILYNLQSRCDWIADELRAQIHHKLKNGSAALQSRGKNIMRKF